MIGDLPDGYTSRAIVPRADLAAASALLRACDLHDIGSDDHQDAWITETWRSPHYRGGIAIQDRAGAVVALGELEAVEPAAFVDLFVSVHPAHRAEGARQFVIGWAQQRATDLAGGPTTLLVSGSAEDVSFDADLTDLGHRHVRTFWHMQRSLPADEQPSEPPAGVRVRPSVAGEDDMVIFEVMHEAFAGHFGFVPVSLEAWWREQRSSEYYDPALFFVAEADGGVAGAASCFLMDDVGWVGELGVLRRFRGRGIGRALLRCGFAELAARGAGRARLNVDSENEAGATRLYRSVGMSVRRSFHVYEKRVGEG